MKPLHLERVVAFLTEKEQFFWGTIVEEEVYIEIYDTNAGDVVTHMTFDFDNSSCDWICEKKSQVEDFLGFYEDYEEIELDYYDENLTPNIFGNIRMTFSVFVYLLVMHLVKMQDRSLSLILCYSPKVNKEDIVVTVSGGKKGDNSSVSYDLNSCSFLTDRETSPEHELYSFMRSITNCMLVEVSELDYS